MFKREIRPLSDGLAESISKAINRLSYVDENENKEVGLEEMRGGEVVRASAPFRVTFELKNMKGNAWSKTGRSFESKAEAEAFIKEKKGHEKYRKMSGVLERGTHYESHLQESDNLRKMALVSAWGFGGSAEPEQMGLLKQLEKEGLVSGIKKGEDVSGEYIEYRLTQKGKEEAKRLKSIKEMTEAVKTYNDRDMDYHIESTKEKKKTIKHPNGKPIYNLYYKGEKIGIIEPYSGSNERRRKGSRIVSSRTDATKYSIKFDKDKGPSGGSDFPASASHSHNNAKDAMKTASTYHRYWIKKHGSNNMAESNSDDTRMAKEEIDLEEARKKSIYELGREYYELTGKKAPAGTSKQSMQIIIDKIRREMAKKAKIEEEKKLDPVGKEDDDIDNDGDTDDSDRYLRKRRKAIGIAMKNRQKGK